MLKHELAMDFQMSSYSNHATQHKGEQQCFSLGSSFPPAVGRMLIHVAYQVPVKWNKGCFE